MTSGDPVQTETADDMVEGSTTVINAVAPAKPDESVQAPAADATDTVSADVAPESDATPAPDAIMADAEAHDDDAWMEACRVEADDFNLDPLYDETETNSSDSSDTLPSDLETLPHQSDDSENEDTATDSSESHAAIEKTGDDAMSKFGNAIGAIAEHDDDLDDRALDYAAEMASPSKSRDSDVAPYIANAERELQASKSAAPLDIFDRIAQAAESQFDETRGSTTKRVSELVDDRRVGTKRWTPSKTMKQRMEKLEAARAAQSASTAVETPAEPVLDTAAPVAAATAAASAPTSSTATMVKPAADKKKPANADVEAVEPESKDTVETPVEERVVISRRDKQAEAGEATESDDTTAIDDEDADELRVVPGARGRRRDRARKSRLDEDFEKIFDDEGKPSIGSLRRKMRAGAAESAETEGASPASASVSEEDFGAVADAAPKVGLFARLLGKTKSKANDPVDAPEALTAKTEDDLVAEFEADDDKALTDKLDFETSEDEDWEAVVDNKQKQKMIATIIIGAAVAIALGAALYTAYKYLFAG